jgi:hypothetical protein
LFKMDLRCLQTQGHPCNAFDSFVQRKLQGKCDGRSETMTAQRVPTSGPNVTSDIDFASPTPDEFHPDATTDLEWLWTGYVGAGLVTLLTSQWKCGKTTLLSVLVARMGTGGTLAGRAVRPGRVLVVSEEDQKLWARRCRQLGIGRHARFMCRPFRGRQPTLDEWWALIWNLVERQRAEGLDLVVIDALAGFVAGGTENDAKTILRMLQAFQELTALGVGVLILHHPRKGPVAAGQAARGSGALGGSPDILLEMDGLSGPADDDRRRKVAGYSRFPETPRRLVIELNTDGTDYAALGDFDAPELDDTWQVLFQVLADAHGKLTRREILSEWPPDYRKPDDTTVWRWLTRAIRDGRVLQGGTGHKDDPFRYWLDGMEEVWRSDPFYLEPLPPVDLLRMRRKTLAEVLAGRKGVTDEGASEQVAGDTRRPRRAAAGRRKQLGGRGPDAGVPAADVPAVADPVPGVVGVRDAECGRGAVPGDLRAGRAAAAGVAAVGGPEVPPAGGGPDPANGAAQPEDAEPGDGG